MLGVNSLSVKPPIGRSEYGRIKVALPLGKGLMDWVRLTTGKVLAKKCMSSVDHTELMKHNSLEDCWIHLFGQVYDVTSYLDFHPGGVPELMRAAGRDATALFNQYHAWVNYESMLKACLVGRFSGDLSKLPPCGPPTVDETVNTSRSIKTSLPRLPSVEDSLIDINVAGNRLTLSSIEWKSLSVVNVVVAEEEESLRVLIHQFQQPSNEILWALSSKCDISGGYRIDVVDSIVSIVFDDESVDLNLRLKDATRTIRKRPVVKYYKCKIDDIRDVTHDTVLFRLATPPGVHLPIPLGSHVSVKVRKGYSTLYRPYTPVGHTVMNSPMPGSVDLMIKIYPDGICTPALGLLKKDDYLEISDPIGNTDVISMMPCDGPVWLLAAGTGLTPMIPISQHRYNEQSKGSTQLVLFNKTEGDIAPEEFLQLKDSGIEVSHVLSAATSNWTGATGRITAEHLPPGKPKRIFVCGPDGFVDTALRLLDEQGCKSDIIHVFQG